MKSWRVWVVVITSMLLLTACSLLSPNKTDKIKKYALDPDVRVAVHPRMTRRTLLVSMPANTPLTDTHRIIYSKTRHRIQRYTRQAWVEEPSQMLLPVMVHSLQRAGVFRAVVGSPFTGQTDWQLKSTLVDVRHIFYGRRKRAQIILDAQLLNENDKIIAQRRFEVIAYTHGYRASAAIRAFNHAAAQLMNELTDFVIKQVKRRPDRPRAHQRYSK